MAVVGLGIDVVAIERFEDALERSPGFLERVFTPAERALGHHSLAARWAAKEALAKALGAPGGLSWQDCEVAREDGRPPRFSLTGTVAARAAELGIVTLHLSLTHDAGIASAVVVAES
ncbi:holo-ACP synthase [Demequina capsici]|uniref:Holo-[acyl-carrier-protein] synthase n=1 Tax=Demequina capsici TaxID=3075620 RepID=A0AA96FAV1_9MICO|nr:MULTISPECIES: holo-ACP synthase [unclassified Demequina]WNM24016.1 holo-ACP synthase [Demequina sp. OYTSA14]WNM26844.1 holo-ACP synthase [Demequina sp. PMTSA13]